jgi:hypothetical protein
MKERAVLLILLVSAMAGCVAGGDAADADEPSASDNVPIGPGDVDPNSEFGVVQGTVLSDEQLPIAGALVGIRGTAFQGSTDSKGVFVFRDVPPGNYAIDVGALGYEAQSKQITVTAGQLTSVSVLLTAVSIASAGYYEIIPHVGSFECALATDVWISGCSYPYTMAVGGLKNGTCYFGPCVPATGIDLWSMGAPRDIQNNVHRFNITIKQNVAQLQAELFWTPSSAAATKMNLMVVCGDYDWIADDCTIALRYGCPNGKPGLAPRKLVVEREDFEDCGDMRKGFYTADANGTKWDLNTNKEIWVMNYVGLPFADSRSDPLSTQVAFQQRFEVWDTIFYNERGPDDWTVMADQ